MQELVPCFIATPLPLLYTKVRLSPTACKHSSCSSSPPENSRVRSASPDFLLCSSSKIESDLSPRRNPQIDANRFDLTRVVKSKESQILGLEACEYFSD
ncbi:hypothetical protein GUJ93_ZPchr0006g45912 [Zizania palustris]|uniref:Uncharacterized protein n=1 Tax=Zizania palustris TaxID=103762 RepID=A0A8J5SKX7_ZIZPA|nr:hypothetical protein GUJ93_ZPchr0006g45912 [Zizania palustris]